MIPSRVLIAICLLGLGSVADEEWRQYKNRQDYDPGCNVNFPEHDPSSRLPQAGDVVEWRCMPDGKGHLRLMARVKP